MWHESVLWTPDLMLHDRSLFNLGELKGQSSGVIEAFRDLNICKIEDGKGIRNGCKILNMQEFEGIQV